MSAITTKVSFVVGLSRHGLAPVVCVQRRTESSVASGGQLTNLAAHKRGTGGRSSFSGTVATVLGATGFVGRYVVNRLGKIGTQVVVPYRGDPYPTRDLRLAGDLGQILFLPYNLKDEASLRKTMQYSDVVINLVGREYPTKNYDFNAVHRDGAARVARIAREMGVRKLIHVSHLNASPDPPKIFSGGSDYLRSKYYGEQRVRKEFPDATILRPSDIYGSEDRFIHYYASKVRRTFGTMLLWKQGKQTVKMPVFVGDVAQGIVNAIQNDESIGQTYECVGPSQYYLSDLIEYFYSCMRYERMRRISIPPVLRLQAAVWSMWPIPPLNPDKLEMEHVSDVLAGELTLEDLGVKPTRLEDRAPWELKPYRLFQYYEDKLGEFPDPIPPPVIS